MLVLIRVAGFHDHACHAVPAVWWKRGAVAGRVRSDVSSWRLLRCGESRAERREEAHRSVRQAVGSIMAPIGLKAVVGESKSLSCSRRFIGLILVKICRCASCQQRMFGFQRRPRVFMRMRMRMMMVLNRLCSSDLLHGS